MQLEVAGIYVINLDSRPERWELFQSELKSWEKAFGKIPERLSAVAGIKLPGYGMKPWFPARIPEWRQREWGGKAGCILSHRQAINKAFEQGWKNVLIVEDDTFLTEEIALAWKDGLARLVLDLPEDWSTIYLCTACSISPFRTIGEYQDFKMVEASGAFGTVAYLLNERIFERVLAELPDERTIWSWVARHKTIDRWCSQNLLRYGRVYLFVPSLVGHHAGSSDICMAPTPGRNLDFTLTNIRPVRNLLLFNVQQSVRRVENTIRRFSSGFRLLIKRLRGL
jgi:glycosyl transferase, family 25